MMVLKGFMMMYRSYRVNQVPTTGIIYLTNSLCRPLTVDCTLMCLLQSTGQSIVHTGSIAGISDKHRCGRGRPDAEHKTHHEEGIECRSDGHCGIDHLPLFCGVHRGKKDLGEQRWLR